MGDLTQLPGLQNSSEQTPVGSMSGYIKELIKMAISYKALNPS